MNDLQTPPPFPWAPRRHGPAAQLRERGMNPSTVWIACGQGSQARSLPLGETLKLFGFSVREAATAKDLLNLAADNPDLIVLEDSLPDQTAADVLHRLKHTPHSTAIPVLLLGDPTLPAAIGPRE